MSLGQKRKQEPPTHADLPAEALDAVPRVEQITREIFGPCFSSAVAEDEEVAGDRYVEFRVVDVDDVTSNVLARNDAWHARVSALPVNVRSHFRLSIESGG